MHVQFNMNTKLLIWITMFQLSTNNGGGRGSGGIIQGLVCIVKLNLIPTSPIILTTLKSLKFIIYLSLLLLYNLYYHLITLKLFPYKNLVIA